MINYSLILLSFRHCRLLVKLGLKLNENVVPISSGVAKIKSKVFFLTTFNTPL